MPTALRIGPYRLFFYSGDWTEPEHIHVERDDNVAKLWLDPVVLERSGGFGRSELRRIQSIVEENQSRLLRHGMSTSALERDVPGAVSVEVTEDTLHVELADGRAISAPLAWYPRLLHALPEERAHWRLIGGGEGIRWDGVDEDVSVADLLAGRRSGESPDSLKKWLESRGQSASGTGP